MFFHYLIRAVALIAIAYFANMLFFHRDVVRVDATENKVSSLSADTRKILDNLENENTIYH